MKTSKLLLMAFCLVFGGGTYLFGQAAVKTNLSADQQKVMDIQQQELAQQNKTREVSILNHPTFPKFVELHDMNLAAANYETAKKAWIEENYEEYNKIIQQSNTSLTPNN